MSMSGNIPVMLSAALKVLKDQKKYLRDKEDKKAFRRSYKSLYRQFHSAEVDISGEEKITFREDYYSFFKYKIFVHFKRSLVTTFHKTFKNSFGRFLKKEVN